MRKRYELPSIVNQFHDLPLNRNKKKDLTDINYKAKKSFQTERRFISQQDGISAKYAANRAINHKNRTNRYRPAFASVVRNIPI